MWTIAITNQKGGVAKRTLRAILRLNSRRQLRSLSIGIGLTLLAGTLAGAASLAAPFAVPITFEGRTGCGTERDAARITLTLRANATYVFRSILVGREQFEGMGSWNVDWRDQILVLDPKSERPALYQIGDAASLKRLYNLKNRPSPACFENLTQSAHIVEFSGRMLNVTLTSDLWTLERLGGKPVKLGVDAKPSTIAFQGATNQVAGSTGCSRFAGTYAQESAMSTPAGAISKLTIFPKTTTQLACESPSRETETRLLSALKQTTSTHICCSTLELFDKRGVELAGFRTTR